jgi:nucleotide-binding universal stress UspA family protein
MTTLIAYDGSDPAAGAIRAAAALLPGRPAVIVAVRRLPMQREDAALARLALPAPMIGKAVGAYEDAAARTAQELADRGAALAADAGLEARAAVAAAPTPWRGLCAAAEEHEAAVIVCGTRGQGGLARAVLGSTSSALLHHAPVPVLVVPPEAGSFDGPVLIGYDGSECARAAVAAVARLLPARPAVVVSAWSSPLRYGAGAALGRGPLDEFRQVAADLDAMWQGESEEVASAGAGQARDGGLDARPLAVEADGAAWRALIAAAESEGAALIAVGSRGRGSVAATLLGSVSAGLAHNADVPVLVVR